MCDAGGHLVGDQGQPGLCQEQLPGALFKRGFQLRLAPGLFRHICVGADKTARGQGVAGNLDDHAIGPGAHEAMRLKCTRHGDALRDLRLDVSFAIFAAPRVIVDERRERRADIGEINRIFIKVQKLVIPRDQPQVGIEDGDALRQMSQTFQHQRSLAACTQL